MLINNNISSIYWFYVDICQHIEEIIRNELFYIR